MNSAALVAIEDIAVAAHARVAGPFVARHADEAPWLVECGGQPVELLPEFVGYLKVVALMADDIHERLIARVAKVAFCRIGADRLAALRMQIAPIAPQAAHRSQRASDWRRARSSPVCVLDAQLNIARRGDRKAGDNQRTLVRTGCKHFR